MKMRFKRILLSIFTVLLFVFGCAFTLTACSSESGPLKIKFNEQRYLYERGSTADVYDFFEKQKGVEYSFAFNYLTKSDSGETISTERQNITGNTIYLREVSRYTLYVTAKRGYSTVSGSTEFDVIGETPVLLPPSISLVYELGSNTRVSILLDRASPIVLPASCDLVVDYYTYQESQAPTLESSGNTNPKIKTFLNTDNPSERVTFDRLGLYEFHVIAYNGQRSAEASFKVKVLPDQTTEVDGVGAYKNAEFGENEDGSVNPSIVRLMGSPELEKASYVVLEEEFVSGQVARFEFFGRNMPSYIGFFNQDYASASDPNSITNGGLGYIFTIERAGAANSARVYGTTRMATGTTSLRTSKTSVPIEHFGFESLEEGKHYFFDVSMKATGTITESSGFGASWLTGKRVQQIALYYSLYEVHDDGSYSILYHTSASRYEASCGGTFFEEGQEVKGKLVAYSSISKDVTFKYHKDTLLNTQFDKNGISYDEETKGLSWEAVEGAVHYVIASGNISSNRIAVLDSDTTSFDLTDVYNSLQPFEALDLKVYASIGNNTFSGKSYQYLLTTGPENLENAIVSGDVISADSGKGTLTVALKGTKAQNAADFQKQVDYVAFNEEYTLDENGTYIDVYFQGNNMPQVEFFANNILGNIRNLDNDITSRGFIVTNGHAHPTAYTDTPKGSVGGYSNYNLFYKYGVTSYNRLTGGANVSGALITDSIVDGTFPYVTGEGEPKSVTYSKFSMYSLMKLQSETQNYRYTVGMFKDVSDGVWIHSTLYKVNGDTQELFASWVSSVVITPQVNAVMDENGEIITEAVPAQTVLKKGQTISGKIVLHAAYKGLETIGEQYYTKFTCSKPYTGNARNVSLLNGGSLDAESGIVTLNGGVFNNNSNYTKNSGYIAFDSESEDGKFTLDENGIYVEFNFTGNNMPNVEFFGNSISGNMFNDGEKKGYVVSNGNGHATLYRNYKQIADNNFMNTDVASAYLNGTMAYNPISFKYNGIANYDAYFTYGVSDYQKFKQGTYTTYDRSNELKIAYYENETWAYNYNVGYSKFSMYSLMNEGELQQWRYVVGMYLEDNQVYLDAKLYKVNADDESLFAEFNGVVETLSEGTIRSGYIVAHAALKGTQSFMDESGSGNERTQFSYKVPYVGNKTTEE